MPDVLETRSVARRSSSAMRRTHRLVAGGAGGGAAALLVVLVAWAGLPFFFLLFLLRRARRSRRPCRTRSVSARYTVGLVLLARLLVPTPWARPSRPPGSHPDPRPCSAVPSSPGASGGRTLRACRPPPGNPRCGGATEQPRLQQPPHHGSNQNRSLLSVL